MTRSPGSPTSAHNARSRSPAEELAAQLVTSFSEQVQRSLKFELDGSTTSLAFVDHYLAQARGETREPILSLLAAGAGAYLGELVCKQLGASWIGDGKEPRRLRLLLRHHFVFFSPVDQAMAAILGGPARPGDPRLPPGDKLDTNFHLQTTPYYDNSQPTTVVDEDDARDRASPATMSDELWMHEQLEHLPPVADNLYFSTTGRFETLTLIVELLSARRHAEKCTPRTYSTEDYLRTLAQTVASQSQDQAN